MAEQLTDLAVVAEPYSVPNHWLGDQDGLVAMCRRTATDSPPLSIIEKGSGYVAAAWGELAVVGVYFSPNRPLQEFEDFLNVLLEVLARIHRQVFIIGDFNAKSVAWGNTATSCNRRGPVLELWAMSSGVSLLNQGTTHTCVRQQGGSVVDLSFATPDLAARVRNWRVELEETLSDHRYIRWEVSYSRVQESPRQGRSFFPRWALSRLDRSLAKEVAFVQDWFSPPGGSDNMDLEAANLRRSLIEVCDSCMPRSSRPPARRACFWWSRELADQRATCVRTRRAYQRSRRRAYRDAEIEAHLYATYQEAKRVLRTAISEAKDRAREEMLQDLDNDPWGRPYKAARNKLRPIGPPLTEVLEPELLAQVVRGLFPGWTPFEPPVMSPPRGLDLPEEEAPPISTEEFGAAALCLRAKKTAPGPDGVPAKIVALAAIEMEPKFRELFNSCLRVGRFPEVWKEGQLCLLKKEGRPANLPSAYRPIVLLDEVGKLFERIIAARINKHLRERGPNLSDHQYGFRAGRSTIDALSRVKNLVKAEWERGNGVLAISFDISNAFNSIPHATILEGLRFHGVPIYIQALINNYLRGRNIIYVNRLGQLVRNGVESGVPQGSVLGPLLWNIGYDWLLRGTLLRGMSVTCYADDTLVTACGREFPSAACLASIGGTLVAERIQRLGLKVALEKTEAIYFYGPRQRRPPADAHVTVGGVRIQVKAQMKYFGLILDARWQFGPHFASALTTPQG